MLPHVVPEDRKQALGDGAVLVGGAENLDVAAFLPASQTQPLPNCLTPASLNLVWKSLKLPKDFLIASATGYSDRHHLWAS